MKKNTITVLDMIAIVIITAFICSCSHRYYQYTVQPVTAVVKHGVLTFKTNGPSTPVADSVLNGSKITLIKKERKH